LGLEKAIRILAGQYFDGETGLHYNYYRHYDLATVRYLSTDPIGLSGGINRYAYAAGNPVSLSDPYGLYVGGIGLGVSAAKSVKNKLGVSTSGSVLWVNDDSGNEAFVACWGAGVAVGEGIVDGLQTVHYPGVKTIYDLERTGLSFGAGAGFARGAGGAIDVSSSGLSVITGVGAGGWGGAVNVIGGCEILKVLKEGRSELTDTGTGQSTKSTTYYGINPLDGKISHERIEGGGGVKYRGKIY